MSMSFNVEIFKVYFRLCQRHLCNAERFITSEEFIQTRLLEKVCLENGFQVETLLKISEALAANKVENCVSVSFREICLAVKQIMEEKKITSKLLIERMGIDRGNYYKLFRSKQESCSFNLILKFAAALESTPSYIYETARTICRKICPGLD